MAAPAPTDVAALLGSDRMVLQVAATVINVVKVDDDDDDDHRLLCHNGHPTQQVLSHHHGNPQYLGVWIPVNSIKNSLPCPFSVLM